MKKPEFDLHEKVKMKDDGTEGQIIKRHRVKHPLFGPQNMWWYEVLMDDTNAVWPADEDELDHKETI